MEPSDEQLLHRFYAGETGALEELAHRLAPVLANVAYWVLLARTGSTAQAAAEWDINERLAGVWTLVGASRLANVGVWPYQRISALTWLVHLLCQELDRHLGMRPPF